ncbi:hypothetical protein ACTA71_010238 [Dictyostelium dimigraforme]
MIKFKILLFFFLLSSLYTSVDGTEFSLFDLSDSHVFYPFGNDPFCTSIFVILAKNTTQSINNLNGGTGCIITSQNSSFTLFSCLDTPSIGTKSKNFSVNNDQSKGYITIDFECNGIVVNNYSVIQEVTLDSLLKFSSIVKLDLSDSISIENTYDTSLFKLIPLGQSIYRIRYTEKYYTLKTSNFSIWETKLIFSNNQNITILVPYNTTKYIGSNTNSQEIINFKQYPLGSATLEGDTFGSLITFQSSSLLQRVSYPVTTLNVANNKYYFSKSIYGDLGNMTYVCFVLSDGTPGNNTLLRRKEDSTFEEYNFETNVSLQAGSAIPGTTFYDIPIETGSVNMYSVEVTIATGYSHKYIQYYNGIDQFRLGSFKSFPFGFISGSNPNFVLGTSVPVFGSISPWFQYTNYSYISKEIGNYGLVLSIPPLTLITELSIPQLINFEAIYLNQFKFLMRFTISDQFGINFIYFSYNSDLRFNQYNVDNLASGSIKNGVFEFTYDLVQFGSPTLKRLVIKNYVEYYNTIYFNQFYSINNLTTKFNFPSINLSSYNYLNDINNISFYLNDIDISNKTVDNIIYFGFNNLDNYKNLSIGFTLTDPKSLRDINFQSGDESSAIRNFYPVYNFAVWDEQNSRFFIKFKVPANTLPGVLDWILVFNRENFITNTQLSDEYQLRINKTNFDCFGPIVSNILKISNSTTLGWLFTIEDEINGFQDGYVTIRGSVDNSLYNITLKSGDMVIGSGNKWKGDYLINITLSGNCAQQDYIITYALFTDTFGNVNKYYKWITDKEYKMNSFFIIDGTDNPFLNFLNDQSILQISTIDSICHFSDSTPPELLSFSASKQSINVGTLDRSITFNFHAHDSEGLRDDQYPIVYITDTNSRIEECISTIVTSNLTDIKYTCTMDVPIGFSHPYGFLISVYGFINRGGRFSGFSATYLKSLNFSWYVETVAFSTTVLIITGSSGIDNDGGNLWLYGRGLKSTTFATVFFSNSSTQIIQISSKNQHDTAILVEGIQPTDNTFKIQLSGIVNSNNFTITPIIYKFHFSTPTPTQTLPTQSPTILTPSPTPTPSLTNKPQNCIGNPVCGGSKQGYCKEDVGCICYSPFIGLDCTSKIIIISQPKPNEDKPTTIIGNSNNNSGNVNNNNNDYQVTGNISIIAIREVNSVTGEQVKIHYIDKWYYNRISSTISNYQSTILNNNISTTINATLEWFENKSNITFANQELIMNPSTIKYTVELSSYKFSNQLTNLQVIIEAQIQSNENDDICSGKEFGDTTLDNSNYIKLQVSSNSIYGRFLKRGIVDGKTVTITNELLDSKLNSISKENNVQSYIGIEIGQYQTSVIIDPDFSLLLDNQAVNSDSPNSVCSSSSSKSLTKGQLAGIIIGASFFFIVIVLVIIKTLLSKSLPFKIFVYKTFRKSKGQEPTTTPEPTPSLNPTCLGNPVCGGANRGYCGVNGCICYTPYFGIDCKSIIIPPTLSPVGPSVEIPKFPNFFNGVLVYQIREIDIFDSVMKSYSLTSWTLNSVSSSILNYQTTITSNNVITTINITTEFSEDQREANNIKRNNYNIQISPYGFSSHLSRLQILFKFQIQSNETNEICSSSEFGLSKPLDDSNFIKLQVSNETLYGIFPTSCFVDNKILSITNSLLDSNDFKSKSNDVQSYVGITIPSYQTLVILNTTFSRSLEQAANSGSPNSICSPNYSTGSSSSTPGNGTSNSSDSFSELHTNSSLSSPSPSPDPSSSSSLSFSSKFQLFNIISAFIFFIIIN